MRSLGFFLSLAAAPLFAGEYVVFTSGQQVMADRHERSGDKILLYRSGGVIEVPANIVLAIEPDGRAPETTIAALPGPVEAPVKAPPAPAPPVDSPATNDPRAIIREEADRAGLPVAFVESVARVESAFRPDAISPKGAIGVMQLMPGTAKDLGVDPYDVRQNIEAGTRLLRELLLKYDGDAVKALAAYNAGEGAVARYGGVPPYNETLHYVNKVINAYQTVEAATAK